MRPARPVSIDVVEHLEQCELQKRKICSLLNSSDVATMHDVIYTNLIISLVISPIIDYFKKNKNVYREL